MKNVRLLDVAEAEILDAAMYYNSECPGLGNTFVRHVRSTLDRIAEYPEAFGFVAEEIRTKQVTKFPYAVLYHLTSDEIIVLAIMHAHRNPIAWQERLKLLGMDE